MEQGAESQAPASEVFQEERLLYHTDLSQRSETSEHGGSEEGFPKILSICEERIHQTERRAPMDPEYRMHTNRELAYPCRAESDPGYGHYHIEGVEAGKSKEYPAPIREGRIQKTGTVHHQR